MTDKAMLTALLTCGRLSEEEEIAFRGMLERVDAKKAGTLSPKQREWAQSVYKRFNLSDEEGSANLISNGDYVPSQLEMMKTYPFELAPRPRKAPGRRCPEGQGVCRCCATCKL